MMAQASQERRREIWERDGGICGLCREPVPFDRFMHLDHIRPASLGGSSEPDNLQASHARCNVTKGGANKFDPLCGAERIPAYRYWSEVPSQHRVAIPPAGLRGWRLTDLPTCDAALRAGSSVKHGFYKCRARVRDAARFCGKHLALGDGVGEAP
jgi:hypothetical protein